MGIQPGCRSRPLRGSPRFLSRFEQGFHHGDDGGRAQRRSGHDLSVVLCVHHVRDLLAKGLKVFLLGGTFLTDQEAESLVPITAV